MQPKSRAGPWVGTVSTVEPNCRNSHIRERPPASASADNHLPPRSNPPQLFEVWTDLAIRYRSRGRGIQNGWNLGMSTQAPRHGGLSRGTYDGGQARKKEPILR